MANRHKFQKGGKVPAFKDGGAAEAPAPKKSGGRALKTGGKVPGYASGGRLDKRARGGGVGADKHPYSSACLK